MKCTIPEISWHNREPVLSIDLYPIENSFYRLASGGSDTLILIWQLKILENGAVHVEMLSELTRHQRAVNCVKWSPNGFYLASGDDDANVIIWQLKTDNIPLLEGDTSDKETWIVHKILRGHKEDIYDICWSPDSTKLLTGSVDNSAILWNITKGKAENIITDHKSFVQGVAWDPKNQYIATLSSDRICRVFDENGRRVIARIGRGLLPVSDTHIFYGKDVKYFHDDTFRTFFRRLTFSPDGSFLVVPSGSVETEETKNAFCATYIFTLDQLKQPVAVLPTAKQCSIVVKCCPVLYELREDGPKPVIDLPYRMIIALATDSDVILYDTQQLTPFARLQNIHYTRLTDLTWSYDGLLLAASSTDGFITLVTFDLNELGTQYIKNESDFDESVLNISGCEELEKDETKMEIMQLVPPIIDVRPKKPSFLEQWTIKGSKRKADEIAEKKISPKKIKEDVIIIDLTDSPIKNDMKENENKIKSIVPKRITPITLGSPKRIKPIALADLELSKRINPIKIDEIASIEIMNPEVDKAITMKKTNPIQVNKVVTPRRINPIKVNDLETTKRIEVNEGATTQSNTSSIITDKVNTPKRAILIKLDEVPPKRITPLKAEKTNSSIIIASNKDVQNKITKKSNRKIEVKMSEQINIIDSKNQIKEKAIQLESELRNKSKENDDQEKLDINQITKTVSEQTELKNNTKNKNIIKVVDINKLLPDPHQQQDTNDVKVCELTNINSAEKKSPGGTKLVAKRKPKDIPPTKSSKMSLLNFFKPKVTPEKILTPQTKSVPIQEENISLVHTKDTLKMSTTSLFKKSKLKKKEPPPRSSVAEENASDAWCKEANDKDIIVVEEDTCEFPEDFNLQLDESTNLDSTEKINTSEIVKKVLCEKQHKDLVLDKHVELMKTETTHRRIPLITLASPKNKKKKP